MPSALLRENKLRGHVKRKRVAAGRVGQTLRPIQIRQPSVQSVTKGGFATTRMSLKKENEDVKKEEEIEQQGEDVKELTPQQRIESWLRRMGDSKAHLDIGPGINSKMI